MQSGQEVVYLHLDDIIPNRFQPREVFDERALKELAASIKEHGVIQPIIVRQVNNKYEIIAGERRYKASALAGMTKIPAIINNLDDKEAAKVALLENLQRKNLNPIEEARTYQKILELDQMTQETLAKTMGKSQSAVANKLRLLSLTDEVQDSLLKENISERHARTLLNIKNPEQQKEMLKRIINEKMSVRTLEEEIRKINSADNNQSEGGIMQNNGLENPNYQQLMSPNFITSQNQQPIPDTNFNYPSNDSFQGPTNKKPNLMDPPISSEIESSNNDNIVNYGEIDEDELANDQPDYSYEASSAGNPIDLAQMKSSANDIEDIISKQQKQNQPNGKDSQKEKISGDLDSLLNIKPPTESDNNGFNPALEALKESENNDDNKKDYFQAPDLMSIELPNSSTNANAVVKNFNQPNTSDSIIDFVRNSSDNINRTNSVQSETSNNLTNLDRTLFQNKKEPTQNSPKKEKSLGMALIEETYNISPKEKNRQYNIHQLVQQIRNTVQELQKYGAKIDTDEMDFENQYQMVIRIDKNSIN